MKSNLPGKVYLVGAGPGDPGLITVRGLELLRKADVVLYDHLSSPLLLLEARSDCYLFDVGKKAGGHSAHQEDINQKLIDCAQKYKMVVRLKGGDPFVFGRGSEETKALRKNHIPYEVIPGVTSAIAAPASLGIPVTERGCSYGFSVFTSFTKEKELPDIDWKHLLKNETAVFLMVVSSLEKITSRLMDEGHSGAIPATIIESGTLPEKRRVSGTISTISQLATNAKVRSPALLVVGELASCDEQSYDDVLSECRIALCGTYRFTNKSAAVFRELGALVEQVPVLNVESHSLIDDDWNFIEKSTWLVFTSSNGVEEFWQQLLHKGYDIRKFLGAKIAAVGKGTADSLRNKGLIPDLIPKYGYVASLAQELVALTSSNDRVSLIRAQTGAQDITKILDQAQVEYRDIAVYDLKDCEVCTSRFLEHRSDFDYIVFGSSGGVGSFFRQTGKINSNVKLVAIGDKTASTLRNEIIKCGISDNSDQILVAKESSVDAIASAIIEDWRKIRK